MKRSSLLAALALATALPAVAADSGTATKAKEMPLPTGFRTTPVDSIPARSSWDNWRAIDRDTLIVWTSPQRPYLLELARSSPDLRAAQTIGVTSTTSRVRAKLDSVIVRGIDYPIREIYALEHDEAWDLIREEAT